MIQQSQDAGTRKITAKWTVESQEDLETDHGRKRNPKFKELTDSQVEDIFRDALDKWIWETKNKAENKALFEEAEQELKDRDAWNLEEELLDIMAQEITREIDNEVLKSVMKEAAKQKEESNTLTMEKLTAACKKVKILP